MGVSLYLNMCPFQLRHLECIEHDDDPKYDGLLKIGLCLLSGASAQAGHVSVDVADRPGDNCFGPEQFSACIIIVFAASVSPQPG